ncbi:MAG: hypothetical protein V3U22_01360, partial [Vicinamibacteria bacterium]
MNRILFLIPFAVFACSQPSTAPPAIRLVDVFDTAEVEGQVAQTKLGPLTEWRFDENETGGWKVAHQVTGLEVRDGRLVGRTTGVLPVIRVERTTGLEDRDILHSIEVRLRVSAGSNLRIEVAGTEEVDLERVLKSDELTRWPFKTPIIAG